MPLQFYGQTMTKLEPQCYTVWVKRAWSDPWVWVPGMEFKRATRCASPDTGMATFEWKYGAVHYPEVGVLLPCEPWALSGWYVRVQAHRQRWSWMVWCGTIETESFEIGGASDLVPYDGVEELTAYGIEKLLERRRVIGTYTDDPLNPYLQRVIPFNERFERGFSPAGNMSTATDADGVNLFSADGEEWTALRLLLHVGKYWTPNSPPFVLCGQVDVLEQFKPALDPDDMTPRRILDQMADYQRGMGWHCVTDGIGPIFIEVFSTLQDGLEAGGVWIPPNYRQGVADLTGFVDVEPRITRSGLHQYDSLVVRSSELIRTCFSLSFDNGLLEEAWSTDEETAYLAADDKDRATDLYRRVFASYRVPADVDWTGIVPAVAQNGQMSLEVPGPLWRVGKRFECTIPFEDSDTDALENRQYRPMLAIIPDDNNDYYYVDRLTETEFESAGNCSVRPAERGLAVEMLVSPNHIFALNHWEGAAESKREPLFDYADLIVTAFVETDSRIEIVLPLWGGLLSETGKTLSLKVPRCEYWMVAPGTIIDVDGGVPVEYDGPTVIRDDSARVYAVAGAALACYGQQSAALEVDFKQAGPWAEIGSLVVGIIDGWQWERIGSVVTSIEIDGRNDSMSVKTNQRNLDYKLEGLM